MNVKILIVTISSLEALRIGLAQSGIIPEGAWEIFKDFPLLAMVMVIVYFMARWFERILTDQRLSLREIYEGNQKSLMMLLAQLEARQAKTDAKIDELAKQVAIMGGTLGEVVNVNDVVDQLMDRLPKRND